MKLSIKRCFYWFLLVIILTSCKASWLPAKHTCCVDAFRLKYNIPRDDNRVIDRLMYAGTLPQVFRINNKDFRWFVFGDEPDEKIALINQDSASMNYVYMGAAKQPDKFIQEDTLFFFDKPINYKWRVHIEGSCFDNKQFTFAGIEYENGMALYRYLVESYGDYTGSLINKIYYSKEKGIMKFEYQTHFYPVEVKRCSDLK